MKISRLLVKTIVKDFDKGISSDAIQKIIDNRDCFGFHFTFDDNYPIRIFSEKGITNAVVALLDIPGVDPSIRDNYCIRLACQDVTGLEQCD